MVTSKKNAKLPISITNDEIEKVIARSHSGVTVDLSAPLEKKTNDKELLARLLEIESAIIEKARNHGII